MKMATVVESPRSSTSRPTKVYRRARNGTSQRRKAANACRRCKQKKIKCSEELPCQNCVRHSAQCIVEEVERRVMVSKRYLDHLQRAALSHHRHPNISHQGSPSTSADSIVHNVDEQPEQQCHIRRAQISSHGGLSQSKDGESLSVPNPLTCPGSRSVFVTDSSGRQRFLGHSSTWSFSWQVRSFLKSAIGGDDRINLVPRSEAETYQMASIPFHRSGPFNDHDIPLFEYAEYLTKTVLLHVGSVYHLFNETKFQHRMAQAYASGFIQNPGEDLWLAQFLLVMAFGKLILGRGASALGPPGAAEFLRAMKKIPDISSFSHEDPIMEIEVICLITLYLFSADMRTTAYALIGQAQRICLSLGMNREIPEGIIDEVDQEHRRRLWWTVYILDRRLSINMGSPLSGLRDEDIDLSLPDNGSYKGPCPGLHLHVKITKLTGNVMTAAYRLHKTLNTAFLTGIQDVFSDMVKLSEDCRGSFDLNLDYPNTVSRTAASLHLSYYQCAILATRPILFTLVQKRLASAELVSSPLRALSNTVLALIKTCIEAASTSLHILSVLHQQGLIEPFLPFDLECLFSSAFVMILIKIIAHPAITIDDDYLSTVHQILTWMCSNGNMVAVSRKSDLDELQKICGKINATYTVPPFGDEPMIEEFTWLWNALDMEKQSSSSSQVSRPGPPSILLMEPGLITSDMTLEDQWLWTASEFQMENL